MRQLALLASLGLVLGACGGRSSTGVGRQDGRVLDKGHVTTKDGPVWYDDAYSVPDVYWPRDLVWQPDSCLPVASGQVQGYYAGTWQGTWSCSGTSTSVSGKLAMTLMPAGSPSSFSVKGDMTGTVGPGFPFSGSVNGGMSCTSFSGTLPDIVIGSGAMIYKLTGSMLGTYANTTGQLGFTKGSWKATQASGGSCYASGTWSAYR